MPLNSQPIQATLKASSTRAFFQIHFCVVLWGFTAILGKAITLRALPLVWWRMALVFAALVFVPRFWKGLSRLSARLIATYVGIGVIVALHWLTFYGDRKSTRLNSSHTVISYAVFCLKKKKKTNSAQA